MLTFVPFKFPTTEDGEYTAMIPDNRVLFHRRQQLGFTQQQVADAAHMQLRQYQRIEDGQSELAGSKVEHVLAICAFLLLDPYEIIQLDVKQPDPASLKPLPAIDIQIPNDFEPKRAGRKPIRRDVMRVYANDSFYSLLIPCDVLQALGSPRCIQLRHDQKTHRIAIFPIWENIEETIQAEEGLDVPKTVYKDQVLGIPGRKYIDYVADGLNWNDRLYSVECRLVKDTDGKVVVLIDLKTAKQADHFECDPVTPWCLIDDDEDECIDDEKSDGENNER